MNYGYNFQPSISGSTTPSSVRTNRPSKYLIILTNILRHKHAMIHTTKQYPILLLLYIHTYLERRYFIINKISVYHYVCITKIQDTHVIKNQSESILCSC